MTKQKEIREGIAIRLHTQERSLLRVAYEDSPTNRIWEELDEYWKGCFRESADQVLSYLHSQGIKLPVVCQLEEA